MSYRVRWIDFNKFSISGTEPTGHPFLGMVGVHYQQNTLGSRSITTK